MLRHGFQASTRQSVLAARPPRLILRKASLAGLLCCLLYASASTFAAPPRDLDAYAERALQTFGAPGMAIGIIDGDRIVARGYGIRRIGDRQRVDEHTLFPIGSNTKSFTAAALAILIEEGKLGWEDRVVDRLPGFRLYDAYATQELTVRDLLVHRSGLGLGAGDLLFFPPTSFTREQIVQRLRYIKPATSFRSGYAYDNVLYLVAGELVRHVSGQSWESFVEQRILAPIGMSDSAASGATARAELRAGLHGRFDGPMRGLGTLVPIELETTVGNYGPAGSIQASATDMARWLQVQLDHGAVKSRNTRIFSEANAREMWTPVTLMPIDTPSAPLAETAKNFSAYALGWEVSDYRGHKILTHGGGVEGGLSVTALIPERHVGFAVMINSEDGGARVAMLYRLLDHYLGYPTKDWIGPVKQAREQRFANALELLKQQPVESAPAAGAQRTGPSLALSGYAGVYRDPWYGTIRIEGDDSSLRIRFDHSPGMEGALEHVRHDTFRTRWTSRRIEDAYVTFSLRPDGAIDQMKMKAISPLADFSFDYHDLLFTRVDAR
jgi:CubicO group peptidase (beta-lactamase class C family)